VREVGIIESIPLLDRAALDAEKQWRCTLAALDGKPTTLVLNVSVSLRLG
jgi:hypothetical protein